MRSRSLGCVSRRCFSIAASTSCRIGVRASKRSGATDCRGRRLSQVPPSFIQLVGGCLVATGFFAWLGALVLAGFTVAATLVGHRFWLRRGAEFRKELTTSLEHVAIVGGLLLLSVLDFTGRGY